MGPGDDPKKGQIAGLETCTDYTPGWGTRWLASGGPNVEKSLLL